MSPNAGKVRHPSWLLLLLVCATPISAQFIVQGRVSHSTGSPAPDARISVPELRVAAVADGAGRFQLSVSRGGYFAIRVDLENRAWFLRQRLAKGESLNLILAARDGDPAERGAGKEEGGSVTVEGMKDRTRLSRYRLSRDEIRRLPGAYGDSLRAVTALPGVSPAQPPASLPSVNVLGGGGGGRLGLSPPYRNSFVSGFLVLRGAGPLANSFLFDGFKIQYPFHLGDQSSVINNEMIRTLDIYTGTFPARFGDASGGVISISGPEEVKRFSGHVNLALFLADAYFETPIGPGFLAASGRRSYPNYTLLKAYPDAIPPNAKYASYSDGQSKLVWDAARGHRISAVFFGAKDVQRYTRSVGEASRDEGGAFGLNLSGAGAVDPNSDTRPPIDLERGFVTSGVRYDARLSSNAHNSLLMQVSDFREDFRLDFRSPLTGESIFAFQVLDAKHELQAREELTYALGRDFALARVGAEWSRRRWELSLANLSPRQSTNPSTPNFVETINRLVDQNRTFRALYDGDRTSYDIQSTYAELEITWGRVRFLPGMRTDYFSLSGSTGLGPRLAAELPIGRTPWTVLAGAGRHFSVPGSLEQVSIESGNPFLGMERADRAAAGVELKVGQWLFKAEAFQNLYSNLVVADSYEHRALEPRVNRRDLAEKQADLAARPVEARPLFYSNDGTGWSQGIEVHLKKTRPTDKDGWFGWVSYTYSLSKRNNHQPRLTDDEANKLALRDQSRHVLSVTHFSPLDLVYYDSGELEAFYDNDREELYDLDRTHQASVVLNYRFNSRHQIGVRWRYADNVPVTPIVSSETVAGGGILNRPTFIPKYSTAYNSMRLAPTHQMDVRYDYFMRYSFGYANYFIELINAYARRNEESQQLSSFSFLYPYNRGVNPAPGYESTYIETPIGGGRNLRLPLINIGLEIKF